MYSKTAANLLKLCFQVLVDKSHHSPQAKVHPEQRCSPAQVLPTGPATPLTSTLDSAQEETEGSYSSNHQPATLEESVPSWQMPLRAAVTTN